MMEARLSHAQGAFRLDVDLALPASGITGLIGRSGAGKSTLFSCLAGHVRPDRGRIALFERVLFDSATGLDIAPAKRGIGVVFQDGLLFPHMTVSRNLTYGARRPPAEFWHEVVDALDLSHLLSARPGRLSGGERQRTAIARALMAEPDLLLLDEPVSALDPGLKARTLDLIAQVQARTAIPMIYISHAPEEVRRICDAVVTMDGGQIVGAPGTAPVAACQPTPVDHWKGPIRVGGRP